MGRIASLFVKTACGAAGLLVLTACPFGGQAKKETTRTPHVEATIDESRGVAAPARVVAPAVTPPVTNPGATTIVETTKDVVVEVAASKIEIKEKASGEKAKDVVVAITPVVKPRTPASSTSTSTPPSTSASTSVGTSVSTPTASPETAVVVSAKDAEITVDALAAVTSACAGETVDSATASSMPLTPNSSYSVMVCEGASDPAPAVVTVQTHADEPSVAVVAEVAAETVAVAIDAKENPVGTEISLVAAMPDGTTVYVRPDTGAVVPEAERWAPLPDKQTDNGFTLVQATLPGVELAEVGFAVQARNDDDVETAISEEVTLEDAAAAETPAVIAAEPQSIPATPPQDVSASSPAASEVAAVAEKARDELKELRARLAVVRKELKALRADLKAAASDHKAAVKKEKQEQIEKAKAEKQAQKPKKEKDAKDNAAISQVASAEVATTTKHLVALQEKIDAKKSERSSLREQLKAKTKELKATRRGTRPRQ